ncbi:WD repeat-containing protein 7-like isoform X1 [Argiope bruennichi]|uniref:WD repeat-containing protein 7-like isoform X1 n=1 Tax=Argiope bruennichi TaxID=94029 RepID=UPI002494EAD6|nr:WD repeat-containing protein 7-like isoform X1 [Argiope bruennichi]XP_055932204.1 WD repeat-containing protein 7-like isoform X1 [Argiope bruennichi]
MTVSNQLVVPVTLWGRAAPTHCISVIYLTHDQKTIITGCNDGRICVWDFKDKQKIVPRCLLFGHTAPVLCLSHGSAATDSTLLVSSSEAGEMSLWDVTDGRCLETVKLPYIHTAIHSYQMSGTNDIRLFCNGYYAEILVMDVLTLDIFFTLSSRVNPDWMSAIHVLRPPKSQDDVIVGLSASGYVKIWTLNGNEPKNEPVYEDESKPIRCLNALKLTCCPYNQRTVLIVCAKYWHIYDAGDFSLLCSSDNPRDERWLGGDFLSADRVIIWSDSGKAYMFKLPGNKLRGRQMSCNAESKDFHKAKGVDRPILYSILTVPVDKRLLCPPSFSFVPARGHHQKALLRGDSSGTVAFWNIPDISDTDMGKTKDGKCPEHHPSVSLSLQEAWETMKPPPAGILDQLYTPDSPNLKLTASVYLPLQGRLVCGREDGSIIIISATQTVLLQLLYGKHQSYEDWPPHQLLNGHNGRVNCLLYPHLIHSRYDIAHLLSGGVDFSVCLWDIYAGHLLHRFSVHAGEITQLIVPPVNCNNRVLQSVCSVASDHSVALLALKDKKCIMLASRHLFPIQAIKFRPLDDFLIVYCSDGSLYVWQMETGHLDRYVQGLTAEEILNACDENIVSSGDRMTNPAIHFFRGLRHRNLAAIRHATQRGLNQLHHPQSHAAQHAADNNEIQRTRAQPLVIQGLRTNPKDQDSHVLFFDIEALVVQLLTEEYASLSPGQLEVQGLINPSEQQKYLALSTSPDTQRKFSGLIAKMKDTAETAAQKIQAKAESVGFKTTSGEVTIRRKDSGESASSTDASGRKSRQMNLAETNLTMEIAQLLLSVLHAWGLDPELDRVCESKLGLLRPMRPVCFGLLSRGGHMALILPTYLHALHDGKAVEPAVPIEGKHVRLVAPAIPPELVMEEERARIFSSRGHWELSTAVTTTHLLAIIALANTLMSMNSATFVPEQERRRKLHRRLSRADSKAVNSQPSSPGTPGSVDAKNKDDVVQAMMAAEAGVFSSQQAQIKQGWSLLAALHCVLLPDLVKSEKFKCPQVEMLARRWQDRCLEVREAAQALLLAELRRIGPKGRKQLVEEWAPYLPNYGEPYPKPQASAPQQTTDDSANVTSASPASNYNNNINNSVANANDANNVNANDQVQIKDEDHSSDEDEGDEHSLEETSSNRPSSATEGKRKQTTAIVLLGVIGAEYGHEIETNKKKTPEDQKRRSVVDGFGLSNYSLARYTSQALAFLLLVPPSPSFPAHTALRRAAIDLIGRGFTVWQPYLDVSKILLGLLELCCDSDKLVPSMSYGLPLTPAADSCRTARHALSLIALARPPTFITCLVKEVARYNTLAQNAQALNISMHMTVLSRSKPEILRVIELLIDKMQTDVSDLLVEVMDIVIHCLDHTQLKVRGLKELFPAICRFYNVTYCNSTRRIAVGAKSGALAIYELRASKCQTISAHAAAINACAFSPDGKYLASYSNKENKLCFWQTATGLFGLGNAQTRCIRTYNTPHLSEAVKNNPLRMARLQWAANKVVSLITDDNLEYRFSVT